MPPRITSYARLIAAASMLLPFGSALAHPQVSPSQEAPAPSRRVPFRIPQDSELRDSAYRASALRGRALLLATRDSLPRNVGNALRCASCHLDNGLRRNVMPWIGSYARFPRYTERSGKVDLIEDRVNDCFVRSMNGKALPASGRDMHDIVAYLGFLSTGIPVGGQVEGEGLPHLPPRAGNVRRGRDVYTATCARCHGERGQGTAVAPPLWGPRSYNVGAGMAMIPVAASFIHEAMPFDRAVQLTEQQAYDVATYIDTRTRPDFPAKIKDWPKAGKPSAANYRAVP